MCKELKDTAIIGQAIYHDIVTNGYGNYSFSFKNFQKHADPKMESFTYTYI